MFHKTERILLFRELICYYSRGYRLSAPVTSNYIFLFYSFTIFKFILSVGRLNKQVCVTQMCYS
jgi:hypothetical protein